MDEGYPAAWDCYLHTDAEKAAFRDFIGADDEHAFVAAREAFKALPPTEHDRYPIEDEVLRGETFSDERRMAIYLERKLERWVIMVISCHPVFTSIEAINARNYYQRTPLMQAADCGNLKVARFLFEHGALVDLQCDEGSTELMRAIKWGKSPAIVKLLLVHGADLNIVNSRGETAFTLAQNDPVITRILLDEVKSRDIRLGWMVGVARGIMKRHGGSGGAAAGSSSDGV